MGQLTDILIPLGTGSKFDNIELRFCLRSIEKHLKGVRNIFIVGERPDWLQNITHIPGTDYPGIAEVAHNIYSKIIAGCQLPELSDNFLFLNDDHFLLSDFEAGQFPYLHRGPILTHRIGNEAQTRQMENTVRALGGRVLDFDIHCPIVYNKDFFEGDIIKHWPEYGYGIKSFYCSYRNIEGTFCEDLKISQPLTKKHIYKVLEGRGWFSVGDKVLRSGEMKEVLEELYPLKSKYEL